MSGYSELIPAITATKLSKQYGPVFALRGINLDIRCRERIGVYGPNGAGKSTLLRIIATLSRPTSGTISIMGIEATKSAVEVRKLIGLVSHQPLLYDDLTVGENLLFYGRMYGLQNPLHRIESMLQKVGLAERFQSRVRNLSRGMQQRVSIARALLHDPPILLLDEPETGLDQQAMELLDDILSEGNRTIVIATHHFEHGLKITTRSLILVGGRLVWEAPTTGLTPADFTSVYSGYIRGKN